jgi:hypothetical protein
MKVKVTDPESPYCGQEFEGNCVYYDLYHTGSSPDLFNIKTPEGSVNLLSTQIDEDHYWNQRRQEHIERLGADVGDTVIVTQYGGGSFDRNFKYHEPHLITKIDSSGYVEFDNGAAKTFRPDVTKVENLKQAT